MGAEKNFSKLKLHRTTGGDVQFNSGAETQKPSGAAQSGVVPDLGKLLLFIHSLVFLTA